MSYRKLVSGFVASLGMLLVVEGTALGVVVKPVTYNLLSGQTVNIDGNIVGWQDKNTNVTVTGTIPVQLSATYNLVSHAASLTGTGCGINFLEQVPGSIYFSPGSLSYSLMLGLVTDKVSWNNLQGTILTPTPPGPVTGSGTSLSFDITHHAVSMNHGTVSDTAGYIDPPMNFETGNNDPVTPTSGTGTITLSGPSGPRDILINSSGYHVTYDYTTSMTCPISFTRSEVQNVAIIGDVTVTLTAAGTVHTDTQTFSQTFNYLPGDANLDGVVDATDLNTVLSFYNQNSSANRWGRGDFNQDNVTDATDLNTVLSYYNQSSAGLMSGLNVATVPEPGTVALLLSAALGLAGFGLWKRSR